MKRKIKKLPIFDRPREKLLRYGVSRLKDEELLAIIFSTGNKDQDVLSLSKKVIQMISDLKFTSYFTRRVCKAKFCNFVFNHLTGVTVYECNVSGG